MSGNCFKNYTTANVLLSSVKRTHRPPAEMVPMEPSQFAAQLISRLENLKREQDTIISLEERLQQIQEVCATLALIRSTHRYVSVLIY